MTEEAPKPRKRTPDDHMAIKLLSLEQRMKAGEKTLNWIPAALKAQVLRFARGLQSILAKWREKCTCERTCRAWLGWLRDELAPLVAGLPKGQRTNFQVVFSTAGYLRTQLEARQLAAP